MTRIPLRRLVVLTTSAVAVALTALGLSAPAQATTAQSCAAVSWGSLAKQGPVTGPVTGALFSNVRAGRQDCYDRLVIDIRGTSAMKSYRVEYVRQVTEDPSGRPVALRGGAFLQIAVGAADHNTSGTYTPANRRELVDVTGFSAFRQVAWAGSSEGISSVGLGVRARLPFRVTTLTGIPGSTTGTRVVIDVAHSW
jgi:hypothetical protein